MDILCSVHDIDDNRGFSMSDFNWCHGPECHKKHTVDRVRGVKGSKVLRTRKVKMFGQRNIWSFFCSMSCYNDFAKEYMAELLAIAPRTEALETPINDPKKTRHETDWGSSWSQWDIKVDESRNMG